jgi:hypothetical protein
VCCVVRLEVAAGDSVEGSVGDQPGESHDDRGVASHGVAGARVRRRDCVGRRRRRHHARGSGANIFGDGAEEYLRYPLDANAEPDASEFSWGAGPEPASVRGKAAKRRWNLSWYITAVLESDRGFSESALRIEATTLNEDTGKPFRFADHQHVAGVDLDKRLHAADSFNACALFFDRVRAVAQCEYPGARHILGHTARGDFLHRDL